MTPERWQRAENLARAALARPPAERADFLAEGSAGDAELRIKADELLSFYVRADAKETVGLPKTPAPPPQQPPTVNRRSGRQ